MVSQNVNQGSATPTKYSCIWNSNERITADFVQVFTHQLTHMYYNWFGTIRTPSVCHYSHRHADLMGTSINASQIANREDKMVDKLHYL